MNLNASNRGVCQLLNIVVYFIEIHIIIGSAPFLPASPQKKCLNKRAT